MTGGVQIEVWLAAGYAGLLAALALGLQAIARHSHRRAQQYEVAGFRYHAPHDLWECPAGQRLIRIETDLERRIARYRAVAHVCNACPIKTNCTDSDDGREISHHFDSWLTSELCRFQCGITLVLLFLAILVLVMEVARNNSPLDLLVLLSVLAPIGTLTAKSVAGLRGERTAETHHES